MREPAVAGSFYPADPQRLRAQIERLFTEAGALEPVAGARACVAPHAGYVYSGLTAAHAFGRIEVPPRVVVLGPNHTGLGAALSVWPGGRWLLPFGAIEIDTEAVGALTSALPELVAEPLAHIREHAVEVELPFLQFRRPQGFRLVPIVVGTEEPALLEALGQALAAWVEACAEPVLLVASSDMNHYEDHETTLQKDALALERLEALDPDGLLATCRRHGISMCGRAPTAALLYAARRLGARRAEVVDHRTSGEVAGDYTQVVGYAAALIT